MTQVFTALLSRPDAAEAIRMPVGIIPAGY
jgi:hypothetical protein